VSRRALLLVEDQPSIRFTIARFFQTSGYEVREAATVQEAVESFRAAAPDAVVVDYNLPDGTAIDLLPTLRELDASVPLIILTAHGSIDLAVRAIKEGAEQFVTKPVELATLLSIVERALEHRRNRQVRQAGRRGSVRHAIDPFLGESPAIRRLAEQAQRLAASNSPVLIQGETGAGKGVLARWLHEKGPRGEEAFVDLNCAGLTRDLMESELFGHEKGAFTGAAAAKPGLLEIAHRGTFFLDEIGDLDLVVQPKLLKVLEDQRFRRLGEVRDRQVDVRLVAGSHRDLARMVEQQAFRADLFYRINTLTLQVPALRDRGQDVILLARGQLARISAEVGRPGMGLDGAAEAALMAYAWPGNVRELRNVLERAALLCDRSVLSASDLQLAGPSGSAPAAPGPPADTLTLTIEEAERHHIAAVLAANDGDVPRAARVLGVARSTLYKKLQGFPKAT
jgi:DNA-binding NtrC family response regulator